MPRACLSSPASYANDEVAAGAINHCAGVSPCQPARRHSFFPATHWASTTTNTSAPPMGTRLRLKASFNSPPTAADDQVILTAMNRMASSSRTTVAGSFSLARRMTAGTIRT